MIGGWVTVMASPSYVPWTAYAPHRTSPSCSLPSTPSHVQSTSSMPEHCGGYDSATGPRHSSTAPATSITVPWPTTSPSGGGAGSEPNAAGAAPGLLAHPGEGEDGCREHDCGETAGARRQAHTLKCRPATGRLTWFSQVMPGSGRFRPPRPWVYPGSMRARSLLLSCRDEASI